jgi:hypothetical protein
MKNRYSFEIDIEAAGLSKLRLRVFSPVLKRPAAPSGGPRKS